MTKNQFGVTWVVGLLAFCVFISACSVAQSTAETPTTPPQIAIIGQWVGVEGDLLWPLFEFREDGTAYLAGLNTYGEFSYEILDETNMRVGFEGEPSEIIEYEISGDSLTLSFADELGFVLQRLNEELYQRLTEEAQ